MSKCMYMLTDRNRSMKIFIEIFPCCLVHELLDSPLSFSPCGLKVLRKRCELYYCVIINRNVTKDVCLGMMY